MYDLVSQVAEEVFIPLTVGGGIRSVADVDQLLKAGADKVSVGSAAIADPNLLRLISERFGSQVLVLSIDAKRSYTTPSGYVVTTHGGRKDTSLDGLDWLETCAKLGVGEVLLNSIDADGVRSGFDTRMLEDFRSRCPVPLIASGGAGSASDFAAAAISGADAVLAASVFHEGSLSINQAKVALEEAGFAVRRSHGTGSVL
jgi:cyclase